MCSKCFSFFLRCSMLDARCFVLKNKLISGIVQCSHIVIIYRMTFGCRNLSICVCIIEFSFAPLSLTLALHWFKCSSNDLFGFRTFIFHKIWVCVRENQHFDKTYKQKSFTFQLRTQSLYIPSPHPTLYHLAHTHTHTNLQRTFILLKVIHFEMVEAYLSMCVCVPHLTREIHKTFRKLSGCNGLLSFPFFSVFNFRSSFITPTLKSGGLSKKK